MTLDDLIAAPFGLAQAQKQTALLPLLQDLTRHHSDANPAYRRIVELTAPDFAAATDYAGLPYLPVSLFKFRSLRSIAASAVRVTVQSSGTTGATPSRIDLDAANARLAARSLAAILATVTGGKRLPMLIIDSETAVRGHDQIGARAAAILGLMPYGRDHVFALDADLQVVPERIAAFLAKHQGENILLFGFTFLVWQALYPACRKYGFDFTQATLLHSGGWKKLQSLAVDNAQFKQALRDTSGMLKVTNFYGMAELPGTIFLEGDDGLLHPPSFADIIIRDPRSFRPLLWEQEGLVQIVNAVAHSYPGHAILTEDMGVLSRADDGSIGLRITGRAPRAEMRGCSDVLAERAA
jgi:hypothetical protein